MSGLRRPPRHAVGRFSDLSLRLARIAVPASFAVVLSACAAGGQPTLIRVPFEAGSSALERRAEGILDSLAARVSPADIVGTIEINGWDEPSTRSSFASAALGKARAREVERYLREIYPAAKIRTIGRGADTGFASRRSSRDDEARNAFWNSATISYRVSGRPTDRATAGTHDDGVDSRPATAPPRTERVPDPTRPTPGIGTAHLEEVKAWIYSFLAPPATSEGFECDVWVNQGADGSVLDVVVSIPIRPEDDTPAQREARADLNTAQRELSELLNRYGERHPSVMDRQSELRSAQETLLESYVGPRSASAVRHSAACGSVRDAVLQASPLPVPGSDTRFERQISLTFRL